MPAPPDAADLFRRHHLAVYRYFLGTIRSRSTAEDLTQEVFLRVLRALPGYRERQRESAWIFRIARNLLRDRLRLLRRRGSEDELEPLPPGPAPRPEEKLLLEEALAALPERDREALLLREVAGLSYEEIARVCDLTVPAVRSRIYRARRQARAWWTGRSDEPAENAETSRRKP